MPELISAPAIIEAAGTQPKRIEEYAGRVRTDDGSLSVARMVSPCGWQEPGQRPEFTEIDGGELEVKPGQAVITWPGEWVRYGTPHPDGAEYLAVCLPAFSPETVHREA
jgi:hypothetical protein